MKEKVYSDVRNNVSNPITSNNNKKEVNKEDKRVLNMIEAAVELYKRNPEDAKMFVDFCDSLVSDGYSLENAIEKTDMVFRTLRSENTYK